MRELSVCMFHAERFFDGTRTAMMTVSLPTDRYREQPDGPWRSGEEGFEHGKQVTAVEHFECYSSTVGGLCSVKSLELQRRIQVQIVEIRMVECALLTDEEIRELGYASRIDYDLEFGQTIQQRRAWWLCVIPLLGTDSAIH